MLDLLPAALPSPHGPVCPENADHDPYGMPTCPHGSCHSIVLEQAVAWCDEDGSLQAVIADHSGPGFTGAGIVVLDLGCGHQQVDLSADTLDAVR